MDIPEQHLRVLVVASDFPPLMKNVARTAKFVKYLSSLGCAVEVLTVNLRSMSNRDSSFDQDIPENVVIYRPWFPNIFKNSARRGMIHDSLSERYAGYKAKGSQLNRLIYWFIILVLCRVPGVILNFIRRNLFIPDETMPWIPFALWRGVYICRRNAIDILFSSGPCFSNHVVAWGIKAMCKCKWVADYRDLWSGISYMQYYGEWRKRLEGGMEGLFLRSMDKIVVVGERMKEVFGNYWGNVAAEKITVIPNGFDPDDYESAKSSRNGSKYIITHTGHLHPGYSLDDLVCGVGRLVEEEPQIKNNLVVRLVGNIAPNERAKIDMAIDRYRLRDVVEFYGWVKRKEALRLQQNSDLLILRMSREMSDGGALSSKIYDYMGGGRPVLVLAYPESPIAALVEKVGCGVVVPPHDQNRIKEVLKELVSKHSCGEGKFAPNYVEIAKFNRKHLTERLLEVFTQVAAK